MTPTGELNLKFWEYVALGAFLVEAGAIACYGGATRSLVAFSVLVLLALAGTGAGSILGFVFGVPRHKADAVTKGVFVHNSNLEQISDWLTKVLVGATLVQFGEIGAALNTAGERIGSQIAVPGASIAATSVIVFSFFAGFMWGYLWISLRVRTEMDPVVDSDAADPSPI